jgi:DNA-binding transcriptional ArsR family regulator
MPGKVKPAEPAPAVRTAGEASLPRIELSEYELASELLRALSTPMRLAIVDLLIEAPRCVHELVDAIGASQPLVSQHLKTLRGAGLVSTQRRGREMVYRLVDEHVAHVARDTLQHAREIAGSA